MTIEALSFIFGCILILIGIIGGGFEVKELKIPKVAWLTRIIAIIAGIAFLGLGFEFQGIKQEQTASHQENEASVQKSVPSSSDTAPKNEEISIKILNRLGPQQIAEEIQIFIEGRLAGNLLVDQQNTLDSAKIKVPAIGSCNYTIVASGVFMGPFGPYRANGRGDGMIEVEEGNEFEVTKTLNGLRLIPR